jgi:hypothetical protein
LKFKFPPLEYFPQKKFKSKHFQHFDNFTSKKPLNKKKSLSRRNNANHIRHVAFRFYYDNNSNVQASLKWKFSLLFYVKELDLSRNRLNGFDAELAEKLLKIENVRFEQNQIICDVCNVGAMLDRKHLVCDFYD